MRIINLDEANINNLINLYMSYCSELRIRKDQKIIKDYFDRAIKHVENNTLDFKVLIEDDIEIGFVSAKSNFMYIGNNDGFILDLYIKDDYRFYGYGKSLLEYIEKLSFNKGTTVMYVTTSELNELFFRNCGYLPTGIYDNEVELEVFYKNLK